MKYIKLSKQEILNEYYQEKILIILYILFGKTNDEKLLDILGIIPIKSGYKIGE